MDIPLDATINLYHPMLQDQGGVSVALIPQ